MPFPYTIASQAIPSVNTTNQLTLDKNTPDVQAQSTISGGRTVNTIAVENKISFSCYYCNAIFPVKSYTTHHIAMNHRKQVDEVMMHNKGLIDSYITDMKSKTSNPKVLASYNSLLNAINKLSFTRMYTIFMYNISEDKFNPNGLNVFLDKLALFMEEATKTPCYKNNNMYALDAMICSVFIDSRPHLKISNISYFMQQTDEQIKKTVQSKEIYYFLAKGNYPKLKEDNQAITDKKLQKNIDIFKYSAFERRYPNFLDEIKNICKQKKIFFDDSFKGVLNSFVFTKGLSITCGKEILEKIIFFLTCIDDQNQYMDTSMLFLLFGFYESTDTKTLSSIIKFKPQVLEQIAKKPQLLEYAKQFEGEIYYIIEKHLEDENKTAKSQTAHNIDVANLPLKSVIVANPVAVVAGQQIRNTENLEASIESKQSHNLTITIQIEEVINNCHQDKANILGALYVTICSTCIQKNISMEDGLLDIFRTLSKKYISCKDAESISNQLRAVVKNLPDNIKIENTSFLNNICNNETGYINGLLALKELSVDEITETIKKKVDGLEPSVEKDDLISSKDIESSNTTELTSDTPTNKKRNLDDYDTSLNNKRFKTGE